MEEAYPTAAAPLQRVGTLAEATESPLQCIASRIHLAAQRASEIAGGLQRHADRALGERPEDDTARGVRPCRMGQIGLVEDALDDLDQALSVLSDQAGRNCTLAG